MGHPMMEKMHWEGGNYGGGGPSPMLLPAPMAFFGTLVAFMLGMMLGMMSGKKSVLMTSAIHKKAWKARHHHHGWGEGPCDQKHGHHGGWWGEHERRETDQGDQGPQPNQAAPGAEPGEQRNEGE
ncbi:MAG TPA: hypothetical protein VLA05_07035 [Coriobacteriia bacterium]|nr:hypothetical protein [Coriobacteriia bacterium]